MPYKNKEAWEQGMIKKHGSLEAAKKFMSSIGKAGGKASTTGGFFANRDLASKAGKKGGRISRRRSSV